MNIIRVPISKCEPWEKNPRGITIKDFERLKKQIQELGVYKPLIACQEKGKYIILGGNMRIRALQELGHTEVDISVVEAKTDAEKNESLTLRNLYKQQIDDMQNGLKRQLTRTEKQQVMDQVILQYNEEVYEPDWFFDNRVRAGTLTPAQMQTVYVKVDGVKVNVASIPQDWMSGVALPEFRKAGVTNPTMKQIAEYWLRKGKPTQ